MSLFILPQEILIETFKFLSPLYVIRIQRVCKRLYWICRNDILWTWMWNRYMAGYRGKLPSLEESSPYFYYWSTRKLERYATAGECLWMLTGKGTIIHDYVCGSKLRRRIQRELAECEGTQKIEE